MSIRLALLSLLSLLLAVPATAVDLPDMVPSIDQSLFQLRVLRHQTVPASDVAEGCAGGTDGRTLVRFTLTTTNEGTADVVLGATGCPEDAQGHSLCFGEPPPPCTNPLFVCSVAEGHHHPHFAQYALYELLPRRGAAAAATGRKQGFCIENTLCDDHTYNCNNQGLKVGCMDAYFNILGCQYVDATDVPGGRYILHVEVNYAHIIPESNYDNNTAEAPVEICDDVRKPRVDFAPAGRKATLTSKGQVTFAKPPLVTDADPVRDGALVRVTPQNKAPLEVAIPAGARGSGCKRHDGWRPLARGKGWLYANTSGFVDAACTVPAQGVERVRILTRKDGFKYLVHAAVGTVPSPAPEAVTTTVVVGAETGPCGTGRVACAAGRGGRVACTTPPAS